MENKICHNERGCECALKWSGDPEHLLKMQDACVFYYPEKPADILEFAPLAQWAEREISRQTTRMVIHLAFWVIVVGLSIVMLLKLLSVS